MDRTINISGDFVHVLAIMLLVFVYGCSKPPESHFTVMDPYAAGISFQNNISETHHNNILRNEYTYNGGGVAVGDVNGDGLTDIYFVGNSTSNKLYLNHGDFEFEDITRVSGTAGRNDWATGVTMVDINGDGFLDIYVCYSGNSQKEGYNLPVIKDLPIRANQLFINNGCEPGEEPTFTDRAKEYGLDALGTFSNQAYFFDYDLDGDLDMLLLNHANSFYAPFINTKKLRNLRHPYFGNKLFRNDNMKFVEVSAEAGLHGSGLNFGLSASISDINMDGWPDMLVTNDYDEQDFCYINNHDGTFKEVSKEIFSVIPKSSMGSDIADINNDGYADMIVLDMLAEDNYRQKLLRGQDSYERYQLTVDSGFYRQLSRNMLQLNRGLAPDGLPRYSEIGQFAGVSNTDWSWSSLIIDLDNDGLKDIFVTNGYLRDITNMDYMRRTSEIYKMAEENGQEVNYVRLIDELPTTRLENYLYRNTNGTSFENVSGKWGVREKNISNGAAYADFDNDGDYDLVTNNLNQAVTLMRNNQESFTTNNYVRIKLKGSSFNSQGTGAKVWIEVDGKTIFQEAYNTRGYLSSSDFLITVGIGAAEQISSIRVLWPEGRESVVRDIKINSEIELSFNESVELTEDTSIKPNETLLKDVTESGGIDFVHIEDDYDDFGKQKLVHFKLSRLGGLLAAADVNGDGNDDVFFGGAAGEPGALFLGQDDATFNKSSSQPWFYDRAMEDMGSHFFDADGDGDMDLYVVSGGLGFEKGSSLYQDRLYLNNGRGSFRKLSGALPAITTSGSCVVSADYDKDGDQDLFVGGRHQGSSYPFSPESYVFRNELKSGSLNFTNVTNEVNGDLSNIGMVTDAVWTDYNGDSWLDLIVVGEWMKIEVFRNEQGKLVREQIGSLNTSNGWWSAIREADIDGDGDLDYLLGNAGTNFQLKASPIEPLNLYAADYDNDGFIDPIMCYYIKGRSFPFHSRDELLSQLKPLEKRFPSYTSYAGATILDLIGPRMMEQSLHLKAYKLASCWMENREGTFVLHDLPEQVQYAPVYSFVEADLDGDGKKEIIAAGNFHDFKPQIGTADASKGNMLRYEGNQLVLTHDAISPLWIEGNVRAMKILTFKSGQKRLVVSRNNEPVGIYQPN